MAKVTNFFVGANSGAGFQNLFGQMVDLENTYDFILLKGGRQLNNERNHPLYKLELLLSLREIGKIR